MKHTFSIIVAIAWFSVPSFAMWMLVPLEELVQQSDLIVVGTLYGVSRHTQNGIDYEQGTILIDEVIWGSANAGDSLTLKWQNESELICPRVEHRPNQGITGIWLLTGGADGVVRANYPGRFVELSERTMVERFLAKNKVSLRTAECAVDVPSQDVTPIMVGPQQEYRLTVDLKTLFNIMPERAYFVRLSVKGNGRAYESFYSGPVADPRVDDTVQKKITVSHTTPGSKLELLASSILVFAGTCFLAYRHRRRR